MCSNNINNKDNTVKSKTELKQLIYDSRVRRIELAEILGISYETLNQQLNGLRPMTAEIENKIRDICETQLRKLQSVV